jgi:hypothetical protein
VLDVVPDAVPDPAPDGGPDAAAGPGMAAVTAVADWPAERPRAAARRFGAWTRSS